MRRRDILIGGAAWAQLIASKTALALGEDASSTRAAVVIGVNKTGNLPILRAAVSGAKSVAQWLDGEGFAVTPILDETQPVTASAIKRAVGAFVDRGTLTQLVIYFSGHGMSFGYNEYWLLTGAPDDGDEAVSLAESWELAHKSGIPNVIFISDACRSIPEYNTSLVHGTVIFPNRRPSPGSPRSEVDRFLAAEPGAPSFEVKLASDSYSGIYTSTFLDAFKHPQTDLVRTIDGKSVIPNILLKDFLRTEVPRRFSQIDIRHTQNPDSRIESRDNNYIGRALGSPAAANGPQRQATVRDLANYQISLALDNGLGAVGGYANKYDYNPSTLSNIGSESGFLATQESILEAKRTDPFFAETGFAINGVRVVHALASGHSRALVVDPGGGGEPALVRITGTSRRPETIGLVFEDQAGTVVAALPGFIGTITVDKGRVMNVTYLPSGYVDEQQTRLDELRALVTTAAQYGVFRIEGAKDARRLADQIRLFKRTDPALAIYAVYAYADAVLTEQVLSTQSLLREELHGDLFDVALLADTISGKRIKGQSDVTPFCPLLTQGWQLLRAKNISLPERVELARNDMRDALWTTFGNRGMSSILSEIQSMVIQSPG